MAGAGFKTFVAGAVLGATETNTYLMQQSVMVFADVTARDTTPATRIASPTEGMVSYVKSVDQIQIYNGSSWVAQPYAQAAGTGDSTTTVLAADGTSTVNITYPTGRFSIAPIVQAWTNSNRYICSIGTNAAGSATVTVRNVSAATGSDATVYYQAVQMSSGTAAG